MTYLVWAAESMYQGLHGIYDVEIIEANSENEVEDYAREMSYDIINGYYESQKAVDEEVNKFVEEENIKDEEAIDEVREEIIDEHLFYNWWELSSEHTYNEYSDMLTAMYWKDLKEKYAIE